MKGDAIEGDDTRVSYTDGRTGEILEKVSYVNTPLGYIYFFITSKIEMVVLIILPCTAICIFGVGKIIYMIIDEKKKK